MNTETLVERIQLLPQEQQEALLQQVNAWLEAHAAAAEADERERQLAILRPLFGMWTDEEANEIEKIIAENEFPADDNIEW